jgi:hypothetical protein
MFIRLVPGLPDESLVLVGNQLEGDGVLGSLLKQGVIIHFKHLKGLLLIDQGRALKI